MKNYIQLINISNMKRTAFLLISILLVSSCDHIFWFRYMDLEVNNESEDTICTYLALGFDIWPTCYPDTFLPEDKLNEYGQRVSQIIARNSILPNEYLIIEPRPDMVEGDWKPFARKHLSHDTLSIFYISKDTLDHYGYDDVRMNNRILLRVDMSSNEVKQFHYCFYYPPRPAMRHLHMSPSYDEFYKWYNNH